MTDKNDLLSSSDASMRDDTITNTPTDVLRGFVLGLGIAGLFLLISLVTRHFAPMKFTGISGGLVFLFGLMLFFALVSSLARKRWYYAGGILLSQMLAGIIWPFVVRAIM